jgi:maleamate amidohydrolase
MARIWDKFLTERDQQVFAASGYGAQAGFGARPALLVIDASYAFVGDRREPILESMRRWHNSSGEEAWDAVASIGRLAKVFRARKLPVIYTSHQYRADSWDAGSWRWKNPRMGDQAASPSNIDPHEIVAEIAPQPQDVVILKQKPSAFFGTNLLAYLQLLGCDSLIMTGGTTSGCIRASVIDAFSYNYRVSVVEEGCFDRSQASHAINLCDINAKYADVIPESAVLAYAEGLDTNLFPELPKAQIPNAQTSKVQ